MTLQESIRMQERFAKRIQPIVSAMTSLPPLDTRLYESYNHILQLASPTYTLFSGASSAITALTQIQQNLIQTCSNINYACAGIEAALSAFEQLQGRIVDTTTILANSSCLTLLESLSSTLDRVEPYLPPDDREKCETIIKPQLKEKTHTRLTLSDALSILSILLSILFFVLGSMPDDQAERIIQQQNKIIANQEAEIAQLREDDQALLNALDSLSNSINLLTDEIELLRDKLKDSDDLPDSPGQTDPGEPQQDDSNTQD